MSTRAHHFLSLSSSNFGQPHPTSLLPFFIFNLLKFLNLACFHLKSTLLLDHRQVVLIQVKNFLLRATYIRLKKSKKEVGDHLGILGEVRASENQRIERFKALDQGSLLELVCTPEFHEVSIFLIHFVLLI